MGDTWGNRYMGEQGCVCPGRGGGRNECVCAGIEYLFHFLNSDASVITKQLLLLMGYL